MAGDEDARTGEIEANLVGRHHPTTLFWAKMYRFARSIGGIMASRRSPRDQIALICGKYAGGGWNV